MNVQIQYNGGMAKEFTDIGFGTTQFWHGKTEESFACALEAVNRYGIYMIDTAEMYGNGKCEEAVGDLVREAGRDSLYLVDKILPENITKRKMRRSLEKSLKLLRTDCIDLYLLHWRENADLSLFTETMEQFKTEGKIREWGVSNFDVKDMEDLMQCRYGDRCYADQIYYNPDKRGVEYDLLPYLKEHHIHAMAYSSLDSNSVRHKLCGIPEISELLARENITVEKLMLEYVQHHGVCALFQTSTRAHLAQDLEGENFRIADHMETIRRVLPAPDHKIPLAKR